MDDLISRDDYREILDEQLRHYDDGTNPFHMQILKLQREILDDMPAVEAIPVEWLRRWRDVTDIPLLAMNIDSILKVWEESNKYWGEVNKGKEAR